MGFRVSTRIRLSGVAVLMAMATGCGGGGSGPVEPPVAPPPPPPASQLLDWDVHPAASVVLGQGAMDVVAPGDLSSATGSPAVTANGRLHVASDVLVRVFDNYAAGGAAAQQTHAFAGEVRDLYVRGNKFVIVYGDTVGIYNDATTVGDQENPDVLSTDINGCGPDAMNAPQAAFITPAGHLIVADRGNNRVLIWNPAQIPENGTLPEPAVVVGQEDKESCAPNAGGGTESVSQFTLNEPSAVWSDGTRLLVADSGNNRVLVWDSLPTDHFQPATHVLGQSNFDGNAANRGQGASEFTLCGPQSVDVNVHGQLAVADSCNHRVLVWNAIPSADSVSADHVIGQPTFAADGFPSSPTAQNLKFPSGARFHDRNLIVVDSGHNRVLVFPASN